MLGDHQVHPVLLSTDLGRSREFYHDRLGLDILFESDQGFEFGCGGGTKIVVTMSTTGTADSQTQLRWEVADIRAELDELRSRGVTVEDYDDPDLKTEDGIADMGFGWVAWMIDPGRNALAISQVKGQRSRFGTVTDDRPVPDDIKRATEDPEIWPDGQLKVR